MDDLIIIENKIYEIRGQKVMLDFDLAKMYEVETKYLKQMVRRNAERFPEDFMFQLSNEEVNCLISRFEVANCNLKQRRYPLLPFRLHRTRRRHAFRYPPGVPKPSKSTSTSCAPSSVCDNIFSPTSQSKSLKN